LVRKKGVKNTRVFVGETFANEGVHLVDCINCTIVKCDFSFNADDKPMLTLENCVDCTITRCKFHDKTTKGQFIKIKGEKSKGNVIDHCEFSDHTFSAGNGGESLQIGLSPYSGCSFDTVVRKCYFHDLSADVECISIKSCGNVIENNLLANNNCNITFRHGGHNKVLNNVFVGSGGIRLYGSNSEIRGNYHRDNNAEKKYRPLIIGSGTLEDDPNFESEGKARGKIGCTHSVYARAKHNVIEGNTYHNCKGMCVNWGYKRNKLKEKNQGERECNGKRYKQTEVILPDKNLFKDNVIFAEEPSISSIMVVFAEEIGANKANNIIESNKKFNAKLGKIPTISGPDKLRSKPSPTIPDVGGWQIPKAKV
jgi:hypothetical protein